MTSPIVIGGSRILEVTVCHIATEPVCRFDVPDGGTLVIALKEDAAARPLPLPIEPGYAGGNREPDKPGSDS